MRQTISALPMGTAFARYLQVLARKKTLAEGADYAARIWPDTPEVGLTLKSEVLPLTSTNASAFLQFGLGAEVLKLMEPNSIVSRLSPLMRHAPFGITVPRVLMGVSVTIVNENQAIPVQVETVESVILTPFKIAGIVNVSNALLHMNGPSVERMIREDFARGFARGIDKNFFDISVLQSVTRGATVRASSGATATNVLDDITYMHRTLTSWGAPRWIMSNRTVASLGSLRDAGGPVFPDAKIIGGFISGIPIIASESIDDLGIIVLMDCEDIMIGDDGGIEVAGGRSASLVMTDSAGSSPAASAHQSMFQTNNTSFRTIRELAWLRGHTTSVVYMTVSY